MIKRRNWYWLGFNSMVIKPPKRLKRWMISFGVWCLFLAFVFAIIALTDPTKGEEEKITKLKVRQACLALDMSASMWDSVSYQIKEKRIVVATNAGKEFVDLSPGDMFALVPFDDKIRMGLAAPLTLDQNLIKNRLQIIADGESGNSTAIGEGIWTCLIFLLKSSMPQDVRMDAANLRRSIEGSETGPYAFEISRRIGRLNHAFIVVLTDGENNSGIDPIRVLSLGARLGIRVYIVAATPERFPELVRAINTTGGRYFFAKDIGESSKFYSEINKLEKKEIIVERKLKPKSLRWHLILLSSISLLATFLANAIVIKAP